MEENYTFTGYLGPQFQLKLMWQILTEPDFGEKILPQLQVTYFDDPGLKRLFIVLLEYFNENEKIPNLQNKSVYTAIKKYRIETDSTDELILTGIVEKVKNWHERVLNKNIQYDGDVVQRNCFDFVKQQEYRKLADYIHAKIKTGDIKSKSTIHSIEEKISVINDIGDDDDFGVEIFNNIENALRKKYREPIPTGIEAIDILMGGGLGKGEMGIVLAASGVGKSTILTKFANEALNHDKNVLQIIFEDNEDDITRKHFTIWSKIELKEIDNNTEYVHQQVTEKAKKIKGNLILKKFSQEDTTIPDIRNWIDRFQKKFGYKFDIIILDYLDCVEPHKKSVDLTHAEFNVVKAFEGMASDYDIPCWTALQTNRDGYDAEFVYAKQMGGSIKRAQKTHFLMSIGKTPDQKEAGTANIQILKARFAQDGQQFKDCIFNNSTLEIRVTQSVRTPDMKKVGEEVAESDKINKKLQNINKDNNIFKDMTTKNALEHLLNIKKDENSENNLAKFLDERAKTQQVIKEPKKN